MCSVHTACLFLMELRLIFYVLWDIEMPSVVEMYAII